MKTLIIIPAYNEGENLLKLIDSINQLQLDCDYIIVNDGSTDNTEEICQKHSLNCITLPINLGIGGAVQTGYKYAKRHNYDIAIQLDGDGQHDPNDLRKLITPIIDSRADFVIGSRFIETEGFKSTFIRRVGIRYFSSLLFLLAGQKVTDPTSGFRACNKKIINLFAKCYPRDYPEPEAIMSLLRLGYSIKEVPVTMKSRENGLSSITRLRSIYYAIKVSLAILIDYTKPTNSSY